MFLHVLWVSKIHCVRITYWNDRKTVVQDTEELHMLYKVKP